MVSNELDPGGGGGGSDFDDGSDSSDDDGDDDEPTRRRRSSSSTADSTGSSSSDQLTSGGGSSSAGPIESDSSDGEEDSSESATYGSGSSGAELDSGEDSSGGSSFEHDEARDGLGDSRADQLTSGTDRSGRSSGPRPERLDTGSQDVEEATRGAGSSGSNFRRERIDTGSQRVEEVTRGRDETQTIRLPDSTESGQPDATGSQRVDALSAGRSGSAVSTGPQRDRQDLIRVAEITGQGGADFRQETRSRRFAQTLTDRGGAFAQRTTGSVLDAVGEAPGTSGRRVTEGVARSLGSLPGAAVGLGVDAAQATTFVARGDGVEGRAERVTDVQTDAADFAIGGVDDTFDIDFERRSDGEGAAVQVFDDREEEAAIGFTTAALTAPAGVAGGAAARGAVARGRSVSSSPASEFVRDTRAQGRAPGGSRRRDRDQQVEQETIQIERTVGDQRQQQRSLEDTPGVEIQRPENRVTREDQLESVIRDAAEDTTTTQQTPTTARQRAEQRIPDADEFPGGQQARQREVEQLTQRFRDDQQTTQQRAQQTTHGTLQQSTQATGSRLPFAGQTAAESLAGASVGAATTAATMSPMPDQQIATDTLATQDSVVGLDFALTTDTPQDQTTTTSLTTDTTAQFTTDTGLMTADISASQISGTTSTTRTPPRTPDLPDLSLGGLGSATRQSGRQDEFEFAYEPETDILTGEDL